MKLEKDQNGRWGGGRMSKAIFPRILRDYCRCVQSKNITFCLQNFESSRKDLNLRHFSLLNSWCFSFFNLRTPPSLPTSVVSLPMVNFKPPSSLATSHSTYTPQKKKNVDTMCMWGSMFVHPNRDFGRISNTAEISEKVILRVDYATLDGVVLCIKLSFCMFPTKDLGVDQLDESNAPHSWNLGSNSNQIDLSTCSYSSTLSDRSLSSSPTRYSSPDRLATSSDYELNSALPRSPIPSGCFSTANDRRRVRQPLSCVVDIPQVCPDPRLVMSDTIFLDFTPSLAHKMKFSDLH